MAGAEVWGPVVSVLVLAVANFIAWAANENSWFFKRCLKPLGVSPLLFISNRAACIDKHTRPISYWAFDLLDPSHLVKSNCLSTPMLMVLHFLTFLYWVAYVIIAVAIEHYRVWCDDPSCGRRHGAYGEWASFVTNWSISILGIAGLVAMANTARQLRRERAQRRQQHGRHTAGAAAAAAAAAAADGAHDRRKVNTGGLAPDYLSPRDRQQQQHSVSQSSVQHVVTPAPAGDLQLASLHQEQQRAAAENTRTSAAAADGEEPGCCLFPHSRHARSTAAGHRPIGEPAGTGAGAATVVMVRDAGSSEGSSSSSDAAQAGCRQELKQKWDCLSATHCILMEVATSAAFFVSFWYWVGVVVIGGSSFDVGAGTMMAHAGNVGVALLQVVLTRLPIVSYHFQVLLWYATLYSIFLWIFGAATGIWRYGLDFRQPRPAGVFIIIPVITFAMFLLWYFAAVIREGVLLPAERKVVDRHHRHKEQRHQRHEQEQQQQQQQQQQHNSVQHAGLLPATVV